MQFRHDAQSLCFLLGPPDDSQLSFGNQLPSFPPIFAVLPSRVFGPAITVALGDIIVIRPTPPEGDPMDRIITSEVVVAQSLCPRKAFLLLEGKESGKPHEYVEVLEQQRSHNRASYLNDLRENHGAVPFTEEAMTRGRDLLTETVLTRGDLQAYCDALTKVKVSSSLGRFSYEPTVVIGTHKVSKTDRVELAFAGLVLGEVQDRLPDTGQIVGGDGNVHKVRLDCDYKDQAGAVKALRVHGTSSSEPPPVILNSHCPLCQFTTQCMKTTQKDDDLSLLDRMTPKLLKRYHKKGIFTVNQLSFLYKPRRRRKHPDNIPITFSVELQALAIRTGTTYIQQLPQIARAPVELYLDIEGIPDTNSQYLIGLLVCEEDQCHYHSFWADGIQDAQQMWIDFNDETKAHPDAPIYHFGRYEKNALAGMARKYHTDAKDLILRLRNVNTEIYGKIYFPSRSNRLKDLGRSIGASWTSPNASGLQSLVWRHRWEQTEREDLKGELLRYNQEDCQALRLLHLRLVEMAEAKNSPQGVDFADSPKRLATPRGTEIHDDLELILRSAHADYTGKKISIRSGRDGENGNKGSKGMPKGRRYRRKVPSNIRRVVQIEAAKRCPRHEDEPLQPTEKTAERVIVDLHFSNNGCRKTVTKYVGAKGFCGKCYRCYNPEGMRKGASWFGHAFQAWAVYQRVALRLPYRVITQAMEDLFNERTSPTSVVHFMVAIAKFHSVTEDNLIGRLLASPFIHVDETPINIQGTDHYVWVFTDGRHVIFRITETRESTIVHEFLSGYQGILVSDFYAGYDALPCAQQKCWVHLIRDLNDDLWKAPFDNEFEAFIVEVRAFLVPILSAAGKYGLKKRHFNKFQTPVDRFYARHVDDVEYHSELTVKYQKRFARYRESLFTFLDHDGIPWNNNMAERAIRHLAVQRKISGSFFPRFIPSYLTLLAIAQTCRFQGKSFLRFLLSQQQDIDSFKERRPHKPAVKVGSATQ